MASVKKNLKKSRNYYDAARLASKMLFDSGRFVHRVGRWMRSFLINKNLSLYYWLKKRIGKESAYRVASVFEKVILIFGREKYEGNRT
jgi:hypothetical protein